MYEKDELLAELDKKGRYMEIKSYSSEKVTETMSFN